MTGSAGLLGHCLVERLVARGDAVCRLDVVGGPDTLAVDLRDRAAVRDAVDGIDVVYHLAAAQRMKPQFAGLDEDEIFAMNVAGVAHVLEAAERARVRKVVWISSSGIYGVPRRVPCGEDHPTEPLGAYGRSKLEGERLCREALARGLDVTVLRPMSLFGPHMTGVFVLLFEWVRSGQPVWLLGRGANRVQFVSARDVADAAIAAVDRPEARGAFVNVGADPATVPTVLEQVRALIAHAGSGSRVLRVPAGLLRAGAVALHRLGLSPIVPEHYLLADTTFVLDIAAAKARLGWQPRDGNVALMNAAYDAYVAAGEAARPAPQPVLRLLRALAPLTRHLAR